MENVFVLLAVTLGMSLSLACGLAMAFLAGWLSRSLVGWLRLFRPRPRDPDLVGTMRALGGL